MNFFKDKFSRGKKSSEPQQGSKNFQKTNRFDNYGFIFQRF